MASDEPLEDIGRKAGRGLGWSLLGAFGTRIATFSISLVLARVLAPAEFGVYGVALSAMAFALQVSAAGIFTACIQWRGDFEKMAPTGTLIAAISSVFVYTGLWFVAPHFADFAGASEATPLIRLLLIVIVIDGLTCVRSAALLRRFEQDRVTKAAIFGSLVNAAVAIPLAFAGVGAYSIVIGLLAQQVIIGILTVWMAHLPLRIGFDRTMAGPLLVFSAPLAASQGIAAVLMNADYVIVGNVLGVAAVGYYLLAFNVSSWVPGSINTAVRNVTMPSFSRLAEHGPAVFEKAVQRTVHLMIAAILPIAVLLATLAPEVVDLLYGSKWEPSAVVLRYLAVLMVARMLTTLAFDVLAAVGATVSTVVINVCWLIVLLPSLWVGVRLDGIRGAAIAHGIVAMAIALPVTVLLLRRAGVRLTGLLPRLVRPALGAGLSAVLILLIESVVHGSTLLLLIAGGSGLALYAVLVVPIATLRQLSVRALARRRQEPA